MSRGATRGHMVFQGRNPLTIAHREPGNSPSELENSAAIHYYLKADQTGPVSIEIAEIGGRRTFTAQAPAGAGINRFYWTCGSIRRRRPRSSAGSEKSAAAGWRKPGAKKAVPRAGEPRTARGPGDIQGHADRGRPVAYVDADGEG